MIIYPAIDIKRSSTRHDELLYAPDQLKRIWQLHRLLAAIEGVEAAELLLDRLSHTGSNEDFLKVVDKTFKGNGKSGK